MLRTIDKYNGHLIQKITRPNGALIGYQTGLADMVGKSGQWVRHTTLGDARKALGMPFRNATGRHGVAMAMV